MKRHAVTLTVNGRMSEISVEPRQSLAEALRTELNLTGTHLGCEHGVCGACTVLVGGEPIRGCLMFAVQAQGLEVTTIEGLSGGHLTPLQESFRRHHALQCGFCTPGMVLTLHALLAREPAADAAAIREAISGNLCRCTGYQPIVEAALAVSAGAARGSAQEPVKRKGEDDGAARAGS
jgi:aerobic-type carbon monoxide dehydrogenase small subunit (CoxS/CutS family)